MAFIKGLDTFDPKKLGDDGSTVVGSVRHVFYNEDTDLTEFDLTNASNSWNEIKFIEDFTATSNTNKIEIFDGKDLAETLEGKTTSELKITQIYRGFLNSIGKLKSKELWFAEAFTDSRQATKSDGTTKFHEIRFYQGKLTSLSEEKGDAESIMKISGDGSFKVTSERKVFAGITPVNPVLTATGGNSASTGVAKTMTVTATDFDGTAITITDLSAADLMGEVVSVNVEKVSGTPTIAVATGGSDAQKSVTFTGTGSCVVKAKIVTANGGIFFSPDLTITVS